MAGADQVKQNMNDWLNRRLAMLQALGDHYAAKMEGEAKDNKPWVNRTGMAQKGLFGEARVAGDLLLVRIAHSVEYGVSLELGYQGKYAILQPTVQRNAPQFFRDVEELMRR